MWSLGCILGEMLLGKFKSFQTVLCNTKILLQYNILQITHLTLITLFMATKRKEH